MQVIDSDTAECHNMTPPRGHGTEVDVPIPVFRLSSTADQYLLYDADTVLWLRKSHRILGVLMGSLPQFPQQNVFQGLPLRLQVEEAQLLCEKGLAFVVDDFKIHMRYLTYIDAGQRKRFTDQLESQGLKLAQVNASAKEERSLKHRQKRIDKSLTGSNSPLDLREDEPFFSDIPIKYVNKTSSPASGQATKCHAYAMTPTASYPPLPIPVMENKGPDPVAGQASYALFKHLYEQSYVLSPGLRFGCRFLIYPGDPLRYHSHFLANSYDWDQEIDLIDIISGGRLGTGVKKSFLIGGTEVPDKSLDVCGNDTQHVKKCSARTRTFCIEWAGI